MRISTLKNEKNVAEAEKNQLAQKVSQYEGSIQDITLKLQGFKREVSNSSQDRVRLQQLEVLNAELNSRLLSLTNEKSMFEGECTQLKKQFSRTEEQLKSSNEKLTAANN